MAATKVKGGGRREGGITLSALRTFAAVVDAGSVSRAAASLGVSQPSVSIQLNGLEQACGVMLLRRRPTLALTEAGRDLLVRARLIVTRLEEFESSVHELRELRRGRLSIGLSAPHAAVPLIASFLARHPAISLTTAMGNTAMLLADVAQCRIDVGIMTMIEPAPALFCALIGTPRLSLCVRADDPLARRRSVRPDRLAARPLIMREQGSMTRQLVEASFAVAGVTPRVRLEIGSREAMKEVVAAGLGIGFIFADELSADSRLAAVELSGAPVDAGIYAVALKESLDIPAVGAFIDHVASATRPRQRS